MTKPIFNPQPKPIKTKQKSINGQRFLETKADRLVRDIVMLRDFRCVCPPPVKNGHSNVMQPGHLITRGRKYVRWDLLNVHVQCSSCNLLHNHFSEIYTKWFIVEFGEEAYIKLVDDSGRMSKLRTPDLRVLCDELEKILAYQREHPNWRPYFRQMDILSGEWSKMC